MDILYRRGRATVREIESDLPDPPTYSAVRALLRVLEEKGHVRHVQDGASYVYFPTRDRARVRVSALTHVVNTFFGGSAAEAVATLLNLEGRALSADELDEIEEMIEQARREGR